MNASPVSVTSLSARPKLVSATTRAGLQTVDKLLHCSEAELVSRTGLSLGEVRELIQSASQALIADHPVSSALQLYLSKKALPNNGRLSVGCPVLDSFLRGGILVPALTEIAGNSAAGKTQLCLQLSLCVQLPRQHGGLEGGAVYVCTEDAFPTKRLQQLVEVFTGRPGCSRTMQQLTDAIFIEHCATTASMSSLLQYKLPSMLQQHQSIKLLVIDSMAALFRAEFTSAQLVHRANLLRSFGAQLHRLSNHYNIAVVCTNQATADADEETGMRPALGLAWADVVGTRLVMYRNEAVNDDTVPQHGPVPRKMVIQLSSHLPPLSLHYYIDQEGIHGIQQTL